MSLHTEIHQQPEVLNDLLEQHGAIRAIAQRIVEINPSYVFLAARGTSDNAGRYANYIWGAHNHLPVALATPSLFTHYQRPPILKGALITVISQSGQSPDLIAVAEQGKRQGCHALAITNAPDSPLARLADLLVDIRAGPEKAVAATKTYTAELLALAMLSVEMEADQARRDSLAKLPGWAGEILKLDEQIARMAERYRFLEHCVVISRGYNYATAFEWSLKLKELTYIVAEPYSSADFLHGPVAMIERGFPVFVVAPGGEIFESLLEVLQNLRRKNAELVVVSDQPEALELAQSPIPLPAGIPEWLSPIPSIIPAQLFSYYLARAKGLDTESPRSIQKVTETL